MPVKATISSVSQRRTIISATYLALGITLLGTVLQFFYREASTSLWILGLGAASLGTFALRRSINGADLPDTPLDEYEATRRIAARESGLRTSLTTSMALFMIGSVMAIGTRFWFDLDALDVALFFSKLAFFQTILVAFSVTASLATRINRDELANARPVTANQ